MLSTPFRYTHISPVSPQAEPVSKGHCWKSQNEAESLMTTYGVIGQEKIKCYSKYVFVMSLPATSLGDWFCMSRKGRTEGGGWVHPTKLDFFGNIIDFSVLYKVYVRIREYLCELLGSITLSACLVWGLYSFFGLYPGNT